MLFSAWKAFSKDDFTWSEMIRDAVQSGADYCRFWSLFRKRDVMKEMLLLCEREWVLDEPGHWLVGYPVWGMEWSIVEFLIEWECFDWRLIDGMSNLNKAIDEASTGGKAILYYFMYVRWVSEWDGAGMVCLGQILILSRLEKLRPESSSSSSPPQSGKVAGARAARHDNRCQILE